MIPDIPAFPTDNLYKFIAVAGLALALLSYWIFVRATARIRENIDELEIDMAPAQSRRERLRREISRIETLANPNQEDIATLEGMLQDLEELMTVLSAKSTILNRKHQQLRELAVTVLVGFAVGIGVSSSGFLLWYHRWQRYQDQLIRQQAETVAQASTVRPSVPAEEMGSFTAAHPAELSFWIRPGEGTGPEEGERNREVVGRERIAGEEGRSSGEESD